MAKSSGLNLAKPRFKWGSCDRLTELDHIKKHCRILFKGPLLDIKEKPKADLIIKWLGQDAAQVLKSMDVEANSPEEVYETLEKYLDLN